MDYGQPVQFGYFLVPLAERFDDLIETAQVLDDLGFEYIGVQDHPYQRRFLDAFTLLTAIAAHTRRIRVFPDVANLPLRPPAMLAKHAASIDIISHGRFDLGIGTGAFWEAIGAMGGPVRSGPEAVSALEEAIQVVRMVWSGERNLRFEGKHYRLAGMNAGPVPVHPIELWVGAYGPRMLRLTGRLGDGWIPSLGMGRTTKGHLPAMNQKIDEGAQAAGRDPAAVRRSLNISGALTEGISDGDFVGPPSQWVDQLTELVLETGMSTFIVGFDEDDEQRAIMRFAETVVPRVRETVAKARRSA